RIGTLADSPYLIRLVFSRASPGAFHERVGLGPINGGIYQRSGRVVGNTDVEHPTRCSDSFPITALKPRFRKLLRCGPAFASSLWLRKCRSLREGHRFGHQILASRVIRPHGPLVPSKQRVGDLRSVAASEWAIRPETAKIGRLPRRRKDLRHSAERP